jgi:hypothetical protein
VRKKKGNRLKRRRTSCALVTRFGRYVPSQNARRRTIRKSYLLLRCNINVEKIYRDNGDDRHFRLFETTKPDKAENILSYARQTDGYIELIRSDMGRVQMKPHRLKTKPPHPDTPDGVELSSRFVNR